MKDVYREMLLDSWLGSVIFNARYGLAEWFLRLALRCERISSAFDEDPVAERYFQIKLSHALEMKYAQAGILEDLYGIGPAVDGEIIQLDEHRVH